MEVNELKKEKEETKERHSIIKRKLHKMEGEMKEQLVGNRKEISRNTKTSRTTKIT